MTGRKHSGKRDAVLKIIRATKDHPGAQWVYERLRPDLPDISLATVYRNIKVLREEGGLISVGVVNGEERFDGETAPHLHAVCKHCGAVRDLPEKAEAELSGQFSLKIPGFTIDLQNTVFYGLCNGCKSAESSKRKKKLRP